MTYSDARRMPMSQMPLSMWAELQIANYMRDIRATANEVRKRRSNKYMAAHLRYLIGRLHGWYFGIASLLIYQCGHHVYERVNALFEAADVEARFLSEEYQQEDE